MKLCKDCRWVEPEAECPHCLHEGAAEQTVNYVTGEITSRQMTCWRMRTGFGSCGPDAALWQERL